VPEVGTEHPTPVTIGVDVGGTFTDFLMIDTQNGEIRTETIPTTVHDRA
jgi:N-methylhydantoinase A